MAPLLSLSFLLMELLVAEVKEVFQEFGFIHLNAALKEFFRRIPHCPGFITGNPCAFPFFFRESVY
jgi:hypothetical protein